VRDEFFDFYLAEAYSNMKRPRWQEAATHYERFLEKAEPCTMTAFAWNNVSIAYRRLGACDRAREAAGKALDFMKFGAAEQNKRYADFCLEMQDGGATAGGAPGAAAPSAAAPAGAATAGSAKGAAS
jgi:tetratricopeptide (TPR) repeat protein